MNNTPSKSPTHPRQILSITAGNLIQLAGLLLGGALLWASSQSGTAALRIAAMLVGYLLVYFTTHSSAHFAVGRLAGIRFRHYSVGGSAHASVYPPGMRQLFERLPFFAVHSAPGSLKTAPPAAGALMFAAGILSTILFTGLAAFFVYRAGAPGSLYLLIFTIIWLVSSAIAEMRSGGDLAKAALALRKP